MIRLFRKYVLLLLCLLALAGPGLVQAEAPPRKPGPKAERYAADYREINDPKKNWKKAFPNLGSYEILAASTLKSKSKLPYNCIAHTLRIYDRWVWPADPGKDAYVSDFDRLYGSHGYKRMAKMDYRFNSKLDKIVLYGKKKDGKTVCTHGSRQLADGTWTSKLGQGALIRHKTPGAVSGPDYGKPIAVYVKARRTPPILPESSTTPATGRTSAVRATARVD
jgi:hypothetical protein